MTRNITSADADKRVEQVRSSIASARQNIVNIVSQSPEHLISEDLADAVNALAKTEGRLRVALSVVEIHRFVGDDQSVLNMTIKDTLFGMLTRGADDRWSGRRNDSRRAFFDGVCEEAQRYL